MKEIFKIPIFVLILFLIMLIIIMMTYQQVAHNKKFALNLERIFTGIFLTSISGATGAGQFPFDKLNLQVLYNRETTALTLILLTVIYGVFLIVLTPRLAQTLPKMLKTLVITAIGNPFLVMLLSLVLLSAFWSETIDLTLKSSLCILAMAIVAIYVAQESKWEELYPWWRWINLLVILISMVKNNPQSDNGCWTGILGHKNQFSFFMAQGAVLWFLNAIYSPKERPMSIFFGILASIAVQKGCSGASRILVVILLGLLIYLNIAKKLPVQWAFTSVVIFLILSIIFGILVVDNLENIVVKGLNKDLTLTGRTEFWPQIIDRINLRPILGYGILGFWQPWRGLENPAYGVAVVKTGFVPPHSHNGFLDLGTELGWLGLFLYIAAYVVNLSRGVIYLTQDKMPESAIPLVILTYQLMTNLTETGLFGITSNLFWFVVMTVRLSHDTMEKR